MSDEPVSYPEGIADAALRRAAQLQAEAAERIERQTLTRASDNRLSRAELGTVARETGIADEYLSLALAEVEQQGRESLALVDEGSEAAITRWLGTRRRSLSVSRQLAAPAAEVLAVLPETFESDEFRLGYAGHSGGHPLAGGVMQFRMARLADMARSTGGYTQLCFRLEQLEIWTVQVTIREHGASTEVVIYLDLRRGALANVRAARGLTGGLGALGVVGVAALCVGAGLGALALLPALAAGAASGSLTMLGYRALYRSALDKTVEQLERMLAAVEGRLARRALSRAHE